MSIKNLQDHVVQFKGAIGEVVTYREENEVGDQASGGRPIHLHETTEEEVWSEIALQDPATEGDVRKRKKTRSGHIRA